MKGKEAIEHLIRNGCLDSAEELVRIKLEEMEELNLCICCTENKGRFRFCEKCLVNSHNKKQRKRGQQELCNLFNEYSCVKDDKWYNDFKKEKGLD